ncbi:TPA: hypothetical protein DCF80_00875, partial [Candidatus Saccharibacteria bacterium]|nr:hypothetical protein [Candidatus Saccharibacteria bacterium]
MSADLRGVAIMSLQTGSQHAKTTSVIVDPKDLTIIAMYVDSPGGKSDPHVLFVNDIRESGELGYIVDDSNSIM